MSIIGGIIGSVGSKKGKARRTARTASKARLRGPTASKGLPPLSTIGAAMGMKFGATRPASRKLPSGAKNVLGGRASRYAAAAASRKQSPSKRPTGPKYPSKRK